MDRDNCAWDYGTLIRGRPMMRVTVAILCLVMVMSSLSCRRGPKEEYPASQPSASALVGKYEVVGDEQVLHQYGSKGLLDLLSDDTFVMEDMPGWGWRGDLIGQGKLWAGRGTWVITKQNRVPPNFPTCRVQLDFDKIAGSDHTIVDSTPYLVGGEPPYEIRIPIGDPDGGHRLILRKVGMPVPPTAPAQ
jgi:hypothetical protein